jgi:hypothetical protein
MGFWVHKLRSKQVITFKKDYKAKANRLEAGGLNLVMES